MKKQLRFIKNLVTIIFVSFFLLGITPAQAEDTLSASIYTTVSPENPGPGEDYMIRLDSSSVNLSDSTITWRINGKTVQSGKDSRQYKGKMSESGKTTEVAISIESSNYGTLTKNLSFSPGSIYLFYEAKTFTPPFYKGKALPSPQSVIEMHAMADFRDRGGEVIPAKNLIYTWSKNDEVDGASSGRGKEMYLYNIGPLKSDSPEITVKVSDPVSGVSGNAKTVVMSTNPEIIIYEDNPLKGVLMQRSLPKQFSMLGSELSLVAYPFYFGVSKKDSSILTFNWSINGTSINKTTSPASITLRKPEGKGLSALSLSIQNTKRIFQEATNDVTISYGE